MKLSKTKAPAGRDGPRRTPKIAVFSPGESSRYNRLLQALSQLYSVEFVSVREVEARSFEAALLIDVTCSEAVRTASFGIRCLAFIKEQRLPVGSASARISLSYLPWLTQCFRGRTLEDKSVDRVSRLPAEVGDDVVARKGQDILWIRRSQESVALDLVSMELPELAQNEYLMHHFRGEDWARLLPLMHFLRELSPWESAPVRACFMFDDPNLHWKSYGYIKYDELIEHAQTHSYHVSVATVPMDAWGINRKTAALFREHKSRLSLLVHGNNHTHRELGQSYPGGSGEALVAQALYRVERLEQLSGLEIPRVMAPPHGDCSHAMANVLLQMGFEAACISIGPLRGPNPNTVWPVTHGLNAVGFLGDGLPLMLRISMAKACRTAVLLAAFLGQPIVAAGHHEDVAGGLDLLEEWAALINSIGAVQWMDIGSIARTNYGTCREGDVLRVKMYSRRIHLEVPADIKEVCIERPWLTPKATEQLGWQEGSAGTFRTFASYQSEPIRVTPGTALEIAAVCPDAIDPRSVSFPGANLAAIGRRYMCEACDRLHPFIHRLTQIRREFPGFS